jgi:hypothetical protein
MADGLSGSADGKVPPLNKCIQGRHQFVSRWHSKQCGIVTDSQSHISADRIQCRTRLLKVASDQFEFTDRHERRR